MANENFIDCVNIFCRSGKGGAGSAHLARTAQDPKAGPDGGDGGRAATYCSRETATFGRSCTCVIPSTSLRRMAATEAPTSVSARTARTPSLRFRSVRSCAIWKAENRSAKCSKTGRR